MISCRGGEGKQVAPSASKDDAPTKRHFYVLRIRGSKHGDDDEGKSLNLFLEILVLSMWESMVSRWDRNS